MKTYRKVTNQKGQVHVVVEENGKPLEVITEAKHPDKWEEYLIATGQMIVTEVKAEKPKKTRKPKIKK